MKYLLMSSNTSLHSELFRSNQKLNGNLTKPQLTPVNTLQKSNSDASSSSISDLSASLSSIPKNVNDKIVKQSLNRSRSEESTHEKNRSLKKKASRNSPINEHSNSDNDESELNKSLPAKLTNQSANDLVNSHEEIAPVKTTSVNDL